MKKNKKNPSFFLRLLVILSFPFIVCLIYLLLLAIAPDENKAKENFTHIEYEQIKLPISYEGSAPSFTMIEADGIDGFWLVSHGSGLYHCKLVNVSCEHKEISESSITDIAFDFTANRLWIGTFDNGVMVLDGDSLTNFDTSNSSLKENRITIIDFDKNGQAWIGTTNGVYISKNGNDFEILEINLSILRKEINEISLDTTGRAWVGTTDGDIFIIKENVNNFEVTNSYSLTEKIVEIAFDKNGRAWVGTPNDIYIFDATLNLLNHPQFGFIEPDVSFQPIQVIKFDSMGRAWIGLHLMSFWKGFAIIENNTPYHFRKEITDFHLSPVWDIEFDNQGNVWMLAGGREIYKVRENITLPLPYEEAMLVIDNQNDKIENFTFWSKFIQGMFSPLAIIWAAININIIRKDSAKNISSTRDNFNKVGHWIFWFFIGGTVNFCLILLFGLFWFFLIPALIPALIPYSNGNFIFGGFMILSAFISGLSYWILGGILTKDERLKRIWLRPILIIISLVFWILPYLFILALLSI